MSLKYRSAKYLALSPEERKKVDDKLAERPPMTEAQKLAQKENFAIFQLKGMLGNLNSVYCVEHTDANRLAFYVRQTIARIKSRQASRQVNRKSKENS